MLTSCGYDILLLPALFMVKGTSKATSSCGLKKQLTASLLNSFQLCFYIMAPKLHRITMFSIFVKSSDYFSKYICSSLILSLASLSLGLGSVALVLFHWPFSSRPQNCPFPSCPTTMCHAINMSFSSASSSFSRCL